MKNKIKESLEKKLIAEYMDIKVLVGFNEATSTFYFYYNNVVMEDYESLPSYKYSWDALMAVVKKINKRDWVTILADECKIHSLKVNEFDTIQIIREGKNVRKTVYKAVLKYIRLVNKLKLD